MNSADLTVIIPTYNSELTIGRALDSIASQTRSPECVIVVDNGSTDQTVPKIEKYLHRTQPWQLSITRLSDNRGPGYARNMAWDAARTSFVAFLDSDDSWHPQKIQRHQDLALAHPNDDFFGHLTRVVRHANSQNYLLPRGSGMVRYYEFRDFIIRNRVSTPTVMLRRDIPYRFPTSHWYAEDFGLWTSILASKRRAVVLDLALTFLHKSPWGESGLSASIKQMHWGELKVLKDLYTRRHITSREYYFYEKWLSLKYLRREFLNYWRR